jgi:hypothetical protein
MAILEECFEEEAMEIYGDVMGLVLAVFEPLPRASLKELQIMGFQDHSRNRNEEGRDTIDGVVCFLGSLFAGVDRLDTPVRPVHTSIRDFLLDETRSGKFAVNISRGHTTLAWGSVQLLLRDLHFNMCHLESSNVRNSEVKDMESRIATGITRELQYASLFWDEHLCQVKADHSLLTLVKQFWYKSSLFWLEALSVLQRINVVARAIKHVREYTQLNDKVWKFLALGTCVNILI